MTHEFYINVQIIMKDCTNTKKARKRLLKKYYKQLKYSQKETL